LKRRFQRWLNATLALVLLMGLLPPAGAMAADAVSLKIINLSADKNNASKFTQNAIEVKVEIQNIPDADIGNLYYEVTNLSTGVFERNTTNKAVKSGSYEATFQNVLLMEGLNEIVIKLDGAGTVASAPGYALYTPATNITNLTVNGVPFDDRKVYPDNPAQGTALNFAGSAPNANRVEVYKTGGGSKLAYFNNGQFFFTGDDENKGNSLADFPLQPGDNEFTIVSSNNARKYQVTRNFIYDNGFPFLFESRIREQGTTGSGNRLIEVPTIGYQDATISGKLKVDVDSSGVLKFTDVDILVGNTVKATVNISGLTEDTALSKPGRYKVFDFTADIQLDSTTSKQTIQLQFRATGNQVVNNRFAVNYVNPNMPYIERAERLNPDILLSENGRTEFNELPAKVRVYANTHTGSINVYVGNNRILSNITPSAGGYFEFELDSNLPNGPTTLRIVPLNTSGAEYGAGAKEYPITISSVPYVIVENIYNGMVIRDLTAFSCDGTNCFIKGQFVNVTSDMKAHLVVNGERQAAAINWDSNKRFSYGFAQSKVQEGKNTFRIEIWENNKIIAEASYEVFYFTTPAPQFISVKPIETSGAQKFIPAQRPDTYTTNENAVSFAIEIANATEIRLSVHSKDDKGNPIVTYDRRYTPASGDPFSEKDPSGTNNPEYFTRINNPAGYFETRLINLANTGETVFEFYLKNSNGVSITRTITIAKSQLPFTIVYPKVITNEKGELQATINSNFVEIELEAEGADSVFIGKDLARKEELPSAPGKYHFFYEILNLKPGSNTVNVTIQRGSETFNGSFVIYNTNTPIPGAMYKTPMANKINVFEGLVQLTFPKGTTLMRNDRNANNQVITPNRMILFGIADGTDGRVDKNKYPDPDSSAASMLAPPSRFRAASELIWIDAGTIDSVLDTDEKLAEAYRGSGRLPYDGNKFYGNDRQGPNLVVPTQPGQLTLKYDPAIVSDAWKYLTVMRFEYFENQYNYPQWGWRNLGGVVNTKNNTITVPFDGFGFYRVMHMNRSYDDITNHPWARNDLDTVFAKGIMLAKDGSVFSPNEYITRGEFATMLVKLFDVPLDYSWTEQLFMDVPHAYVPGTYYDWKYIDTAANAGIIRGITESAFRPGDAITRQDAAVMIARAANLKVNNDPEKVLSSLQKQFTDANNIDIYALGAVEAVNKAKIIQGIENVLLPGEKRPTYRFDPLEPFTRAQAAAVAMRILQQQKKVPR